MKVEWKRGKDELNFNKPSIWFSLGVRGSGKSTFLESVGEEYLHNGGGLLDLFGSRDGEGLAWLRSPWVKDKRILLLRGENVEVKASYEVKCVDALEVRDFDTYDIIISASPLYTNIDQEFLSAAKIEDQLYKRLHYKKLVYMCCREAANFYYSRLKVADTQTYAKAQMIYLLREARHMGVSIGLDSIRYYAIDIDIRDLSDYLILKRQGVRGFPRDLKWLYRYLDAHVMRTLPAHRFAVITQAGAIGYGIFPELEWHKKEKENILDELGLKIDYGEILQESILKGTYNTVSDKEHVQIIMLYHDEGLAMGKIAEKLKRSPHTPNVHIRSHDAQVKRSGFCAACKRAKGSNAEVQVGRNK